MHVRGYFCEGMSHILIKWVAEEKWDVYPVRALADTNVGYRLVAQEGAIKKLRGSIQDVFWEEGQPAAPAILLNCGKHLCHVICLHLYIPPYFKAPINDRK